jgi:glutathione S-transferase
MADYTFYTNPMSRGQIVRWALHEADADYEQVLLSYGGTIAGAEYLAVNPMGKVPALVHHHGGHDHVVTECAAICHYLAEMTAPELLPRIEEKADYFRYLFFAAGPLEQAVVANSMGWSVEPDKQAMTGFGSYERATAALEVLMTGRDYVCGARFTMADVYVGSQIDWGLQFGSIPTSPVFEAYAARLRDRAAYKQAKAIDAKLIEQAQAQDS